MKNGKTIARVERKRESYNLINRQAKKLALLSISKTYYKHEESVYGMSFCVCYTN